MVLLQLFMPGKIHRNVFVNSLDVNFTSAITIDTQIENPTGIGNVYSASKIISMIANLKSGSRNISGKNIHSLFGYMRGKHVNYLFYKMIKQ